MPTPTYIQIGKVVLSSGGTVSFSSIPSIYTDLRIVLRHGITNSGYALGFQINGSNSGYNFVAQRGINGGASAYLKQDFTYGAIHSQTATGSVNNLAIIDFFSYAKTDRFKTYSSQMASNAAASAVDVGLMSGNWNNAAAISSIVIAETGDGGSGTFNTGNLLAGTTAILYGIKGA